MNKSPEINEKWIKASVIGTIWAASEIVLGSFLHNLRIPFSSNLLTGIGIIILISTSYKWTEKGLYWRAGLICALMKTLSPSAIIFGPMIAIFSQALLLEFFTRTFGKNIVGFALGAMFATTWNLFQKIANFIIFYGFNIVEVYSGLLKYAQKQLNVQVDLVWSPIVVLALIYCSLGLVSAIIGMKVGEKLIDQPADAKPVNRNVQESIFSRSKQAFAYSILWLIVDIVLVVSAFVLLNFTPWYVWSTVITGISIVWIIRYKRALRQLLRPKFWISFILITMLTAFVFSKLQSQEWVSGLITGIQMNFRAVVVILGFSVLGTELYNPKIRGLFLKTSFKQLPLALELSFESLPLTIATVPDIKTIIRNPVSVIYQVISQIEYRLEELKGKLSRKIFIIAGGVGQGKTAQLQKTVNYLKENNITVGGILSRRILQGELTAGYVLVDVETGAIEPFLRISDSTALEKIGKYSILPKGLEVGTEALNRSTANNCQVVVVDEIGKLELYGKGWSANVAELIHTPKVLIFAVRDTFVEDIIKFFGLRNYSILKISDGLCAGLGDAIVKHLS